MKILIVDDEDYICSSVSRNLKRLGFEILTEIDGEKVINVIEKEKPEIVLLDLLLGHINGIDILREIKKKHPNIIVIVVTADEEKETENEALKEGADEFLRKPFKADFLRKTIRQKIEAVYLKRNQMQRPSVLLVDDSDDYRQQIAKFMSNNYQADLSEAKDGVSAVKLIKSKKFDLVILDIKMPGQDGIKVLNEIKDSMSLSSIIVLSGYEDKNIALKAVNMGAFGFLSKSDPEIFENLKDKVDLVLINQGKLLRKSS